MATIRKRRWTAADGQTKTAWQVDYKDQHGNRRSKQFLRKKDADVWAVTAASEVQRGIHTPDSLSISVEQAADLWLESVRANDREPTTVAAYEQHVRLHIVPKCGTKKLSQINSPQVRSMLDDWLSTLSRPMATRVFRSFKAILSDAQERGHVAQNVALAVKVKKAPREKAKVTIPSKAELRAILEVAEGCADLKSRAIMELVIFSGIRASELRGLTWTSIDLKRATVTIHQRADAKGVIGPPKSSAGFRTIPLPSRVLGTLRSWKVACPAHKLDLVFPSQKGRVLSHQVLANKHLKPLLVTAGVTKPGVRNADETAKYTAHLFRHAAASLWIEQGMNPKRVQTLVGHGSIQVTFDTYGHLFEQAEKNADDASAIERALFFDAT